MKSTIEEFRKYVESYMKTTLTREGKIIPAIFYLWPDDYVLWLTLNPDLNLSEENKRKINEALLGFQSNPNTKASATLVEVDPRSTKVKNGMGALMIIIRSEFGLERFEYRFDRQTRTVIGLGIKNNEMDLNDQFSNFFDFNMN